MSGSGSKDTSTPSPSARPRPSSPSTPACWPPRTSRNSPPRPRSPSCSHCGSTRGPAARFTREHSAPGPAWPRCGAWPGTCWPTALDCRVWRLPGMAATDIPVPDIPVPDIPVPDTLPTVIGVRGARHNNLQDVDVNVALWRMVTVVGVSGSGKTSLAMGTLYAEGLQRFLEGLSTYSRRRLTQAQRPDVDRIDHLPPALALRQRPPVPGPRSTVGTMSEVLNVLRLMMSRLGSHLCPNGHLVAPSIATQSEEIVCPVCGARFEHPSAESFAFNSYGACPTCHGLGVRSEVDVATLVPDPGKTIEEGAVLPWNSGGRRLSMYAAGEQGVRLDVPYRELTDRERDIVLHGEPVKRQVTLSGRNGRTVELSVNYDNAVAAVERSLRSDNERTRRLVQRFLITRVCSVCHGTRLRPEALTSQLGGRQLADVRRTRP